MPADIFVYALVAAGLVFWLRSILGTRQGDEQPRPNPYLAPAERKTQTSKPNLPAPTDAVSGIKEKIDRLRQDGSGVFSIRDKTAEAGLLEILGSDKDFDIKFFLDGSREAFAIIVEAFAQGDRETLKDLLAPAVYEAFSASLDIRAQKGEVQETEIHSVNKVQVLEARVEGKAAYITLRFEADETNVLRGATGEILSGHPGKIARMSDIWVFGRMLRVRDPRWLVYETRGDFEGDNDMIPNTGHQN